MQNSIYKIKYLLFLSWDWEAWCLTVWGVIPPPPERNTVWNKGRKCFHCLWAPNNLIRPCPQPVEKFSVFCATLSSLPRPQKVPPLTSTLSQINRVHILPSYFLDIYCNINIPVHLENQSFPFASGFLLKTLCVFLFYSMHSTFSVHITSLVWSPEWCLEISINSDSHHYDVFPGLIWLPLTQAQIFPSAPYFDDLQLIQGGSNMTGTDLYVNKPHCAAAVRPWEREATTSTLPPARVRICSVLSGSC